ncbi:MAG TPA: phosphatase PAP2 family protein [Candidatus Woesebacteria bacterium]|nr:phosphatase PAP2 family protein [Candidatus Woesebacteria bacterium]HPJ17096.1 phosphatase PAP2 family protein [Candidatus Woesebacteria bacterium]
MNFKITSATTILFILFTKILTWVDVQPIGPRDSSVGLATINKWVSDLIGVNMFLYQLTDWASLLALLVAGGFGCLGVIQLFKRKSLKKVDFSILVLGGFYILVIMAYVFFEFWIVNYRPVLIENVLEASYPSSTTMIVLTIMITAVMQFNRLIKKKSIRVLANSFSIIYTILMVTGRLFSGVHWLTDIIGAILLSMVLIMIYCLVNKFWTK